MNKYFDDFREAGTAGKEIKMKNGAEIFSDRIIQTYKEKGVRYFITNDFVILPIHRLRDYFDVTAKYRIKRSGSCNVGNNKISSVLSHITSADYSIDNSRIYADKLFIQSKQKLHNKRFIFQQYEYMFSQRDNEYEVRRLSNTYNANVIFSIN